MFIKEACRRHSENCDWGYYIKDENDFSVKAFHKTLLFNAEEFSVGMDRLDFSMCTRGNKSCPLVRYLSTSRS